MILEPILVEAEVEVPDQQAEVESDVEVPDQQADVEADVETEINPIVNTDYEALENKPSINGVELAGNKTSAELGIDRTYIFEQTVASDTWTILHNLDKFPSVTIVDSAGTEVIGGVQYVDENTVICTFAGAFSGTAYLN